MKENKTSWSRALSFTIAMILVITSLRTFAFATDPASGYPQSEDYDSGSVVQQSGRDLTSGSDDADGYAMDDSDEQNEQSTSDDGNDDLDDPSTGNVDPDDPTGEGNSDLESNDPSINNGSDDPDESTPDDMDSQNEEEPSEDTPDGESSQPSLGGIAAPDVSVLLGNEEFDLLDGVQATDSEGGAIETEVADDGGFDVWTPGEYLVSYRSTDPHTGQEYSAQRHILVEKPAVAMPAALQTVSTYSTLKQAIEDADPVDTIVVDNSFAMSGTLTIPAGKTITLTGADPTVTLTQTIGARHFTVSAGAELILNSIQLDGDGVGGGVLNNGKLYLEDDAVLTNCGIPNVNGGAVLSNGDLEMSGGAIKNSVSRLGGGVYIIGTLHMTGGEIVGNETTMSGNGGGVYLEAGSLILDGGAINGNVVNGTSSGNGGGVFANGSSSVEIRSGSIDNNVSVSGGGVWMTNGDVTMTGGTVNGNTAANGGGGLRVGGGTFLLSDGEIKGNLAKTSSLAFGGGGVYAEGTSFTMTGGLITDNTCGLAGNPTYGRGGGVYSSGHFVMKGGTISNNTTDYHGGGVYVCRNGTSFDMYDGAVISGNRTLSDSNDNYGGGGVYVDKSTFNMHGGTISGNVSARSGGGVFVLSTDSSERTNPMTFFTMTGGTISGNQAVYGGGMRVWSFGVIRIENAIFSGNTATNGGGVYNSSSGAQYPANSFTIGGNTSFTGNTATADGGGVYNMGGLILNGNLEFTGNRAAKGGGLYNRSATPAISGTLLFDDNTAVEGGAIYNTAVALTLPAGATITNNTATDKGGGIRHFSSRGVEMNGGLVEQNTAPDGGGIYTNGELVLNGTAVRNNQGDYGGGLYLTGTSATATLTNTTMTGNTSGDGGAVYLFYGATLTLGDGVLIEDNEAPGGGAIHADDGQSGYLPTLNIGGTARILGNRANEGGAVYAWYTNINVSGSAEISGNEANADGGAFRLAGCAVNTTGQPFMQNNQSKTARGGAIFLDASTLNADGITLSDNSAALDGGAIYATSDTSPVSLTGATLNGNRAGKDGGGIWVANLNKLTVTGSTFSSNLAGNGGSAIKEADKPLHSSRIVTTVTDRGPYVYNNHDVNYQGDPIQTPKWTVTFDHQYDSIKDIQLVDDGEKVARPTNPNRPGYRFVDWYAESTCQTPWDFDAPITRDVNIYAKWEAIDYTVTFDANGGSFPGNVTTITSSANYHVDDLVNDENLVPAYSGFDFSGVWYTEAACINVWNFTADKMPAHNLTLYAGWEPDDPVSSASYHVIYDANGGSYADGTLLYTAPGKVNENDLVPYDATVTPAQAGHSFTGRWYLDAACSVQWIFPADPMPGHDLVLYAGYEETDYTVTFHANGGAFPNGSVSITSPTVYHMGDLVLNDGYLPTRSGFRFTNAWYTEPGCATAWDFTSGLMGENNLVLYADWDAGGQTATYPLTFHANGGAFPDGSIQLDGGRYAQGEQISDNLAPTPWRGNYRFAGWRTSSGKTWNFAEDVMPAGALDLYALWTPTGGSTTPPSGGNGGEYNPGRPGRPGGSGGIGVGTITPDTVAAPNPTPSPTPNPSNPQVDLLNGGTPLGTLPKTGGNITHKSGGTLGAMFLALGVLVTIIAKREDKK